MLRFLRRNIAITAALVMAVAITGTVYWASASGPVSGTELRPDPTMTPLDEDEIGYDPVTREDVRATEQALGYEPGVTHVSGPETKGTTIYIADKSIKLPDDAYVEHKYLAGSCKYQERERCPEFPVHVLRRGGSEVVVGSSGRITKEEMAAGDEDAFQFLKEALR